MASPLQGLGQGACSLWLSVSVVRFSKQQLTTETRSHGEHDLERNVLYEIDCFRR